MKEITKRQREVLNFISSFISENGFPPTVREIGAHFSISLRAVQDHVAALQKKGYLSQSQKRARSLSVLSDLRKNKEGSKDIPLLRMALVADKPLLSEENIEGSMKLSEPFIQEGKEYFALKVRGTSMKDAGILEGDLAIIEQANSAVDGQIVVAVVDGAVLLRRFYKETDKIRLQPENPEFSAIYCTDLTIVGILSSLVRQY